MLHFLLGSLPFSHCTSSSSSRSQRPLEDYFGWLQTAFANAGSVELGRQQQTIILFYSRVNWTRCTFACSCCRLQATRLILFNGAWVDPKWSISICLRFIVSAAAAVVLEVDVVVRLQQYSMRLFCLAGHRPLICFHALFAAMQCCCSIRRFYTYTALAEKISWLPLP
jgi:hypothetical protein